MHVPAPLAVITCALSQAGRHQSLAKIDGQMKLKDIDVSPLACACTTVLRNEMAEGKMLISVVYQQVQSCLKSALLNVSTAVRCKATMHRAPLMSGSRE